MSYTADRLGSYADDVNELDKDVVRQIDEECKKTITSQTQDKTFRMMYRATSDTSYLYKANDERAENINLMEIKFLKRKNLLFLQC